MKSCNRDLGFEHGSLAADDILPKQAETSHLFLAIDLTVLELNGREATGTFLCMIE